MTSSSPDAGENNAAAVLELLASRICHDLISPVGAVNNGVEFLQDMGPDAGSEAIELIAYSAGQAAARLQAFRLAYGAGGRDPNIKPADVHETFGELIGPDGRVKQDWSPAGVDHTQKPQGFCKILMGALMLAAENMPKGGVIRTDFSDPSAARVVVEGPDAAPRPRMKEALARALPVAELDPRLVHAYALSMIAAQYGFGLALEQEGESRFAVVIGQSPANPES